MPPSRAELLRIEAEHEERRQGLRRKLHWCYGAEEGERRFRMDSRPAVEDIAAWNRIAFRGERPEPISWTRIGTRILRSVLADVRTGA